MNNREYPHVKTIRLDASSDADLAIAAQFLRHGGVVALPTETVYGLAANGLCEAAIKKVFLAKNRPLNNPLILHTHDAASARALLDLVDNERAQTRFSLLAQAFWPGPLTIIATKARQIPSLATAGLSSAAVRVPHNAATRAIIAQLGFPLVMPSANLSTRPSPTAAAHVLATLDGRIDGVVDDGHCPVGIESTVVTIEGDQVEILRPGMIDEHAISACLHEPVLLAQCTSAQPAVSPGLLHLHYSPLVKSVIVARRDEVPSFWIGNHSILLRDKDYGHFVHQLGARPHHAQSFRLHDDPKKYAQELYEALYAAEQFPSVALVIVLPDETEQDWSAIIDRLRRTARSS